MPAKRGELQWPPGNEMHKSFKLKKNQKIFSYGLFKNKKTKNPWKTTESLLADSQKCCLVHIQWKWCKSGLSSSASYRRRMKVLYFGRMILQQVKLRIAGFFFHLAVKRGDRALTQLRGGVKPTDGSFSPRVSPLQCPHGHSLCVLSNDDTASFSRRLTWVWWTISICLCSKSGQKVRNTDSELTNQFEVARTVTLSKMPCPLLPQRSIAMCILVNLL